MVQKPVASSAAGPSAVPSMGGAAAKRKDAATGKSVSRDSFFKNSKPKSNTEAKASKQNGKTTAAFFGKPSTKPVGDRRHSPLTPAATRCSSGPVWLLQKPSTSTTTKRASESKPSPAPSKAASRAPADVQEDDEEEAEWDDGTEEPQDARPKCDFPTFAAPRVAVV